MRLARGYGSERMEAACRRALATDTCTYKSIKSILATKMDRQPLPDEDEASSPAPPRHENIRGERYYNEPGTAPPSDHLTGQLPLNE